MAFGIRKLLLLGSREEDAAVFKPKTENIPAVPDIIQTYWLL